MPYGLFCFGFNSINWNRFVYDALSLQILTSLNIWGMFCRDWLSCWCLNAFACAISISTACLHESMKDLSWVWASWNKLWSVVLGSFGWTFGMIRGCVYSCPPKRQLWTTIFCVFEQQWCETSIVFQDSIVSSSNHVWMDCPVKFQIGSLVELMTLVGLNKVPSLLKRSSISAMSPANFTDQWNFVFLNLVIWQNYRNDVGSSTSKQKIEPILKTNQIL